MRTQTTDPKHMSEFHKHLKSTYKEENQINLPQSVEPYDSHRKRSRVRIPERRPELVLEPKTYNDEIWVRI